MTRASIQGRYGGAAKPADFRQVIIDTTGLTFDISQPLLQLYRLNLIALHVPPGLQLR